MPRWPIMISVLLLAACGGTFAEGGDPVDAGSGDASALAGDATLCTPGVSQNTCPTSNTIVVCSADGAQWVETSCEDGSFCFSGACVDYPCAPGAVACTDPKTLQACLADPSGASYGWQLLESCPRLCREGACVEACGFDPKFGATTPCEHFVIELEGSPDNGCDDPGLFVVPSSADDMLAVFDLSSEPPVLLAGSPFPTCDDPSRIMITGDARIVSTCRGDGHAVMHAPDGEVIWDVKVPDCSAVRGAVVGPDGRLFVGCTSSGRVHELDPEDGEVLGALKTGLDVYGMAADRTGVYLLDGDTLAKIDVSGGSLTLWWSVDSVGYGLATDGEGSVWVSQPPGLARFSGDSGDLLESVPISVGDDPWIDGHCNGVAVARDGRVLAGCADSGEFMVVWDPVGASMQVLGLPEGHSHPRGATFDHDGNAYAINMISETLVRFDRLTQAALAFGDGALSEPYGYSGDMTALTPCHLAGTATWTSPQLSPTGEDVLWLAIEWRATVPPETEVAVSYRLGETEPWVRVLSGMAIEAVSPTLQIQAELRSWSPEAVPVLHEMAVFHAP